MVTRVVAFFVPMGLLLLFTVLGGVFEGLDRRLWVLLVSVAACSGLLTSLADVAVSRWLAPSNRRERIRRVVYSLSMLTWVLVYLIFVESENPVGMLLFMIPVVAAMAWFGLG